MAYDNGCKDFMNENNSYLVPVEELRIDNRDFPGRLRCMKSTLLLLIRLLGENLMYAEPSISELRAMMRYLSTRPHEAKGIAFVTCCCVVGINRLWHIEKAHRARVDVLSRLHSSVITESLIHNLVRIERLMMNKGLQIWSAVFCTLSCLFISLRVDI